MNEATGWRTTRLADVAIVDPESITVNGDELIDYISLEDVTRGRIAVTTQIRFADAPSRARRKVHTGDVLFGTVRPNLQSHAQYKGGLRNPVASTGFAVIRARPGAAVPGFLAQWALGSDVSLQVDRLIAGSNYPAVSGSDVRQFQISVPDVDTQAAIASALEDADDLIAALERLIVKKQAIKQGMMQELLTGRARLPGFTEPWHEHTVEDLATITKGHQLGRSEMDPNQSVPVWNGGVESSGFTNTPSHDRPVVTVSEGGNSCGWVGKPDGPFWLGGHCYALSPENSGHSVAFLYYALKSREPDIMALRVGSGLPNIQVKRLADFALVVPRDGAEADAIATVLDDAECEIDLFRQRLAKAKGMKQGMMQELLTGRTRLPVTEVAA